MKGTILSVCKVMNEAGGSFHLRTVIYEVNGVRYRGCVDHKEQYYFGGGGEKQPFLSGIDEAFEIAWGKIESPVEA